MSNHRSSRRRDYGRRQKEVRDRRSTDLPIDLEGPTGWARAGAWASDSLAPLRSGAHRTGTSLDGAGA
ncbi:MAG: hypothetical protein KF809_11660 [Chloroflexi bacterium]|nr:hypothetical protein [Chloroflexota bacterium]